MAEARRAGGAADAVLGIVPREVVAPAAPEELAAVLSAASGDGRRVLLRGGGSKLEWGRVPERIDLLVSTARLNQVLAHRHGDLTATVQAGTPLVELNRVLARHAQWLPVESAFPAATVGGLVATNESGPSRHRHGTPRDLLIGVTLALADGRLVRAGGTVVKNVAGYDLGRLMSGSFGGLAAIVDATFKLMPLPQASTTLAASYADVADLATAIAALASSQLEPGAVDVRWDPPDAFELLVRFASSPGAVEAQVQAACAILGSEVALLSGDEERMAWERLVRAPWSVAPEGAGDEPAVVRFSWLPASLPEVVTLLGQACGKRGSLLHFSGRALVGAGAAVVAGGAEAQAAAIERLRASRQVAHVVVVRGGLALRRLVDVWGPPGPAARLARTLKQSLDPAGVLGPDRGPI